MSWLSLERCIHLLLISIVLLHSLTFSYNTHVRQCQRIPISGFFLHPSFSRRYQSTINRPQEMISLSDSFSVILLPQPLHIARLYLVESFLNPWLSII
jgi:hypothetical protein